MEKSIFPWVNKRQDEAAKISSRQKKNCITRDEDTGVVLRRWGAAGLPAVPPAHQPGQTAEAAAGQTPSPAETASAKQAQHSRSGRTDPRTRLHVQ